MLATYVGEKGWRCTDSSGAIMLGTLFCILSSRSKHPVVEATAQMWLQYSMQGQMVDFYKYKTDSRVRYLRVIENHEPWISNYLLRVGEYHTPWVNKLLSYTHIILHNLIGRAALNIFEYLLFAYLPFTNTYFLGVCAYDNRFICWCYFIRYWILSRLNISDI